MQRFFDQKVEEEMEVAEDMEMAEDMEVAKLHNPIQNLVAQHEAISDQIRRESIWINMEMW